MFRKLPLTIIRITIASILSKIVRVFYASNIQIVKRNKLFYELDLTEGIDFSVFLLGNFQKYIFSKTLYKLSENAVIIDVGANMGNMTLQFAQLPECEKVYSFEPTDFAYPKLLRNIELNPQISNKITVIKSFVSDTTTDKSDIIAYASWKIGNKNKNSNIHPLHLGSVSKADETPSISIDNFCELNKIHRVDLIKIDTDGHELKVLKGAKNTIKKFKPYVIFEVGLYVLKEQNVEFTEFLDLFIEFDCDLVDLKTKKQVNRENFDKIIPHNSTTDLLICPRK